MASKIILLATLLAYSAVVSQSFMYLIALKKTQLQLQARSYIELRKLLDSNMRINFKYVMYAALATNLLLVVVHIHHPDGLLFITGSIALACLIADAVLTTKQSIPINKIINGWAADRYPQNWSAYRSQWLSVFRYRQLANLIGFACLAAGAVFS